MVKQALVHLHKETQLSNKKEQTTDTRKKLDLEGIMLSGKVDLKRLHIFITPIQLSWNNKTIEMEKRKMVARDKDKTGEGKLTYGDRTILYLDCEGC